MSLHTWRNDWTAWLLDGDLIPIARLDDLVAPSVDWNMRDECSFTATLVVSSQAYASFDVDADQFVFFQRLDKAQVFSIDNIDIKWKPIRGKTEKAVDIAGEGGASFFLGSRIIQANPAGDAGFVTVSSRTIDDAIKEFIRLSTVSGTAYDDPDADPRHIPGFAVAADTSEHPTSQEWKRTGSLWDVVELMCLENDIDITLTPTWNGPGSAVTMELETHYQGRGADNGVFLNDLLRVYNESAWHTNRAPMKTHGYLPTTQVVYAPSAYSGRFRREVIVEAGGTADLAMAMQDMREEKGHTFGFQETRAAQVMIDFWLGDTIAHHDTELNTVVRSEFLGGVKITIEQDELGSENIELVFGDKKPKQTNSKSGGRRSRTREPDGPVEGAVGGWYIYGDTPTNVGPNDENAIGVVAGDATIIVTENVGANQLELTAAIGTEGCFWDRGTAVFGGTAGLYPHVITDVVSIGGTVFADSPRADTMLQVHGAIAVDRYVHAPATSLVLYGLADSKAKVHIGESGLPDGWLDVYDNGGVARWRCDAAVPSTFAHGQLDVRESGGGASRVKTDADDGDGKVTWTAGVLAVYEGKAYRWPTDAPAEGDVLTIKTAAATNLLEWTPPVGTHNLLSATHDDTDTKAANRGEIIVANVSNKWTDLSLGAANTVPMSNGLDLVYGYPYGRAFVQDNAPATTWAGQIWVDT